MGFSVHSVFIWGTGIGEHGCWITTISRVIEKSGIFTCYCMDEVIDKISETFGWIDVLSNYLNSDAGPTYRCGVYLGSVGFRWLDKIRKLNGTGDKPGEGMLTNKQGIGIENHSKSKVDRYFSQLKGRIQRAEKSRWIKTIAEVCAVLEEEASWKSDEQPREMFIPLLPTKDLLHNVISWLLD